MGGDGSVVEHHVGGLSFHPLQTGIMSLVLFIGFDFASFAPTSASGQTPNVVWPMLCAVFVAGIVLTLWSLASYNFVDPKRLAETSVPYAITARTILGETGRKIMGLVLIFGACGAVNALLTGVSRMMAAMGSQGLLPSLFSLAKVRATVPLILLTLSIAAMLALGMAGEPLLGTLTKSGIFLWLVTYGSIHLSVLILRTRGNQSTESFRAPWYPLLPLFGLFSTGFGVLLLVRYEAELFAFLKVLSIALTATLFFSIIWVRIKYKECDS